MSASRLKPGRRGRAARRTAGGTRKTEAPSAVWPGVEGGRYAPLAESEMIQIHVAVLHLLETVGLSQAPKSMIERVCESGGELIANDRLLFPRKLVEQAISEIRRDLRLYSRRDEPPLDISGNRVHTSTGGGTPTILDFETGTYRPSTARALYDAARLVDEMEQIRLFSRSMGRTRCRWTSGRMRASPEPASPCALA